MPVSAVVLTLSTDPTERAFALGVLEALHFVSMGEPIGPAHLPVVLESGTLGEGEEQFRALTYIPGVIHADLAMVDFEDVEEFQEPPRQAKSRRHA